MELRHLHLIAYGHFSDLQLPLAPGFNLIYGPNEAGKSTALRAVRQLFYGFDHRARDDFQHPTQSLRVGATLLGRDGTHLEIVRRRGRLRTLRAADDATEVDSAQLERLLGGIDQETFVQRFGIDYDQLVAGGQAIVRGQGEWGAILFAAASGLVGLHRVQQALEDEAGELFKPAGSTPRVNKCLTALRDLHQRTKESQLSSATWEEQQARLTRHQSEADEVAAALHQCQRERDRLERIHTALPVIRLRESLRAEQAQLAGVPSLSDAFTARRLELWSAQCAQQAVADGARLRRTELARELAEISVAETLLAQADRIQRLQRELGSFLKAQADRQVLVERQRAHEAAIADLHRELGRELDARRIEAWQVTKPQRLEIQHLAQESQRPQARLEAGRQQEEVLIARHTRVRQELEAIPSPVDIAPQRLIVKRWQTAGDLDAQLASGERQRQRLETQVQNALSRLGAAPLTLAQLECAAIPSLETIGRYETEFSELAAAITDRSRRLEDTQQELQRIADDLLQLRAGLDLPTEAELATARERRERGWQLVLRAWQEPLHDHASEQSAFVAEFPLATDLATAYALSVAEADRLADQMRRQAEQIARQEAWLRQRHRLMQQLAQAEQELATLTARRIALEAQWRDVWQAVNLVSGPPREMLSWHHEYTKTLELAEQLHEQADRVDELQRQRSAGLAELAQVVAAETDRADGPRPTFKQQLEEAVEFVEQAEQRQRRGSELRGQLRDLQHEQALARQAVDEAKLALAAWQARWAACMADLQLAATTAPETAMAVLSDLETLSTRHRERQELHERTEGIDRDAEAFSARVRETLTAVAPQLLTLSLEVAVPALQTQLETAQKAQVRRTRLLEQLAAEDAALRGADLRLAQHATELSQLCQEAGCTSPAELPAVEERARRKREVAGRLDELQEQLAKLAGGLTVDQLLQAARDCDVEALDSQRESATRQIEALEARRETLLTTLGGVREALAGMDGSAAAAEAESEAALVLADLETAARQYVRLRLASTLLARTTDRFREKNQGPVLARAGRLFAELTGSSFDNLRVDADDDGRPILVGVRPSGRPVRVDGMSEGTCDQLYLALRVASLEHYLQRQPPIPFVIDDILIKFDDIRAAAALRILAALGEQTQVIFFTHHQHLVELARAALRPSQLTLHALPG